jgi:hypothetical protein
METTDIKDLSIDDKKKLIDLIEGMPYKINKFVKVSFNDDFLDPSIYKGSMRNMSPYSSLLKYMKKDSANAHVRPIFSFYQTDFCDVFEKIDNLEDIPKLIINKLYLIMYEECYDEETLAKTEVNLVEILNECGNDWRLKGKIAKLISTKIIPYKTQVCDFYTFLSVKNMLNITSGNYDHLQHLTHIINSLIENNNYYYSEKYDLAVFIYVYFAEIGMVDVIEKYDLLSRFVSYMRYEDKKEDYISDVVNKVTEYATEKRKISDVLSNLVNMNRYGKMLNLSKYKVLDTNDDPTYKSIESNGICFLSKNIDIFRDNINTIALNLRKLKSDDVFYGNLDATFKKEYVNFNLSENDFGHLLSSDEIVFATAYDGYDGEMRYIGYYNDQFYLFFTLRNKSKLIYGLSIIPINNEDRALFCMKESKAFNYKYTTNI